MCLFTQVRTLNDMLTRHTGVRRCEQSRIKETPRLTSVKRVTSVAEEHGTCCSVGQRRVEVEEKGDQQTANSLSIIFRACILNKFVCSKLTTISVDTGKVGPSNIFTHPPRTRVWPSNTAIASTHYPRLGWGLPIAFTHPSRARVEPSNIAIAFTHLPRARVEPSNIAIQFTHLPRARVEPSNIAIAFSHPLGLGWSLVT